MIVCLALSFQTLFPYQIIFLHPSYKTTRTLIIISHLNHQAYDPSQSSSQSPTTPFSAYPPTPPTNNPPVAIRRKSLSPYTFRSGTPHIPTGTITSVSSYNLMHDPDYYPNPDRFDGLRYTRHRMRDDGETERENPMFGDAVTEVRREFPVWGFGGHVWFVSSPSSFPLHHPPRPFSSNPYRHAPKPPPNWH